MRENLALVNKQFGEMVERSFGTDRKNYDDFLANYKDPIQMMLEEIAKFNKEMAKKAMKRQTKLDIKA